ncbi:MAG: chemotaxis protein CheW [Thermomonas sp.]
MVLADYEERSLAHIAGLPEQLDAPGLWRGVAYRIGSHRLASGFDEVVEILPLPALTMVPGAQPWMLGVANVRGTLLPVVDLKQFLEGERTVLHESQRVLVVRQPGGEVAVTIDELYGQRSFVDGQGINVAQVSEGRYSHFIDRAYRMGEQDWGVFSLDRLARTPEFRQAAA